MNWFDTTFIEDILQQIPVGMLLLSIFFAYFRKISIQNIKYLGHLVIEHVIFYHNLHVLYCTNKFNVCCIKSAFPQFTFVCLCHGWVTV